MNRHRLPTGVSLLVVASLAVSGWCQLPPPGSDLPAPPPQPGQLGPAPSAGSNRSGDTNKADQPTVEAPAGSESPLFVGRVQTVLVPTTVFDRHSRGYVNGLQVKDFEVLDNDKPQRISGEITEQPVSVVVVVQANSEIEPVLPDLKNIGLLLHGLVTGQEGDAAILAFDHRKQILTDFTNDPGKLDDAMHKLTSGSSSCALVDAVMYADGMLKRHDHNNNRRRVILLVSRNVDKGSETKLEEAIHTMQFDNIILYAVDISKWKTLLRKPDYPRPPNGGVPPEALPPAHGNIMTPTDVAQQQTGNWLSVIPPAFKGISDLVKKTPAEAFTQFTGGQVYGFSNMKGLEQAITDIGKELNSQYLLSYSPNNREESGFHHIRVVVNRPGLEVRTRPGYWWGGGQQQ